METIQSGTTGERTVRALLTTLIVVGFAAYFLRDGYLAYPKQNVEWLAQTLGFEVDPAEVQDVTLTSQRVEAVKAAFDADKRDGKVYPVKNLLSEFGEPRLPRDDAEIRYLGRDYLLRATLKNKQYVQSITLARLPHSQTDLRIQVWLGYVLVPFSVFVLFRLFLVLTTRVVLSEAGLQIGRAAPIPFDAMTALDSKRYVQTGYVDLVYEQDGRTKTLRLDNYVIKEFRPMIEALCEKRQFPNPLPPLSDGDDDA